MEGNGMFQDILGVEKDILTTKEAAQYIAKSPAYLRTNHQRLGIKAYKIGRQLRFRRSELDAWLNEQVA